MQNADDQGVTEVRDAAFAKLVSVLPEEEEGTFVHAAWKSIHALEEMESHDRGKTIRLSRTRQKIQRDGVRKTLEDLAGRPTGTRGFDMLIERGMPELTFEAIVLLHQSEFSSDVLEAARKRLEDVGVNVSRMLASDREQANG